MNRDEAPPRVFSVVTVSGINYNADFIDYLVKQELARRSLASEAPLSQSELNEFRKRLIALVNINQDIQSAINLRPSKRIQLNG